MKFSFHNKYVIITGASSGIGRGLAYALAERGAKLVLLGRNTKELQNSLRECEKRSSTANWNSQHYMYSIDLTKDTDILSFIQFLKHNAIDVDVLVLNAGTSMHARIMQSSVELYRNMYESNCITAISITQALLPSLVSRKSTIVVMNSVQSIVGAPYHGAYAAAKHALSGYLETLEFEEPSLTIVELKLGWIRGTNIRSSALGGDAKVHSSRKHDSHHRSSVSLETCINNILYAIEHKKRCFYIPQSWRYILFAKYAFRGFLRKIIVKRTNKDIF